MTRKLDFLPYPMSPRTKKILKIEIDHSRPVIQSTMSNLGIIKFCNLGGRGAGTYEHSAKLRKGDDSLGTWNVHLAYEVSGSLVGLSPKTYDLSPAPVLLL